MAIIAKDTLYIAGKSFVRRIRANSTGLFLIKLPDFVAEMSGKDEVTAMTMMEVIDKFNDSIREYENSKTTKKKVICYDIKYNAYIFDTEKDRVVIHEDMIHFAPGMVLQVSGKVYIEEMTEKPSGGFSYHYKKVEKDEQLPNSLCRGVDSPSSFRDEAKNKIDWTQERHDFFVRLAESMEGLIIKISKFGDQKKLIEMIDKGGNLLDAPKEGG